LRRGLFIIMNRIMIDASRIINHHEDWRRAAADAALR
jgi:hypothetical protein